MLRNISEQDEFKRKQAQKLVRAQEKQMLVDEASVQQQLDIEFPSEIVCSCKK